MKDYKLKQRNLRASHTNKQKLKNRKKKKILKKIKDTPQVGSGHGQGWKLRKVGEKYWEYWENGGVESALRYPEYLQK
jgi:hypothetical protein